MRREASRVSFLMCPFCVRASSSSEATVPARAESSAEAVTKATVSIG
jgi:hypothetical protein